MNMTLDHFIHDALRAADPDEMRIVRGRQAGTVTLITGKTRQKRAFVSTLPTGRTNVSRVQRGGTYFWLVQAPSEEAQRALRELGWTELPSSESPTEARAKPLKNRLEERAVRPERGPETRTRRRLCGAWERRTRRR